MPLTVACAATSVRSVTNTRALAAANAIAMAAPMPDPAPVTRAILLVRSNMKARLGRYGPIESVSRTHLLPALSEAGDAHSVARRVEGPVTRNCLSAPAGVRTVRTVRRVRTVLLVPVLVLGALVPGCGTGPTTDRINIAVIPKGTSHAVWQSVHAGPRKAATELN